MMANLSSQGAANQIFPFVILPQYFLAGVFNPITRLPWYLDVLSRISPLRNAVDLVRGAYYLGRPDYDQVVLRPVGGSGGHGRAALHLPRIGHMLFVRGERNREARR
ncbi:MAG: ABC transporter permease [Chloroflexi bacterium]|nr:ABC transporter permease [Chloroflexota bacterium]